MDSVHSIQQKNTLLLLLQKYYADVKTSDTKNIQKNYKTRYVI